MVDDGRMNSHQGSLKKGPIGIASIVAVVLFGLLIDVTPNAHAAGTGNKVTICHRTHSQTNPYRRITVAKNSVSGQTGHSGHTGPAWTLGSSGWGDIIPSGVPSVTEMNYSSSAVGKAIYDGGIVCRGLTALNYLNSEIAANQPLSAILADLDNQEARDDAATLSTLGGTIRCIQSSVLIENRPILYRATPGLPRYCKDRWGDSLKGHGLLRGSRRRRNLYRILAWS